MIQWYLSVKNLIRSLGQKASDALPLYKQGGEDTSKAINGYMKSDYDQLLDLWCQKFPKEKLNNLGRHIDFGMDNDYLNIIKNDLPEIEKKADAQLLNSQNKNEQEKTGIEDLLHPIILKHSYQLYKDGHLRESVFNAITAIYDFIRDKTGLEEDGDRLIGQAMSIHSPVLILSEIDSESGQNDQKGFMQIFKGAYQGIRNPKAHSLMHDLTPIKAAQYLVFASLLARRVDEAEIVQKNV